jgi:hypothetical protein
MSLFLLLESLILEFAIDEFILEIATSTFAIVLVIVVIIVILVVILVLVIVSSEVGFIFLVLLFGLGMLFSENRKSGFLSFRGSFLSYECGFLYLITS